MVLNVAPIVLASLLMAAHFLRGGQLILVLACLLTPLLLLFRKRWVPLLVQGLAYAGAGVWVKTALALVAQRRLAGAPWGRMALILGGVALFTGLAGLLLNAPAVRRRYRTGGRQRETDGERR
jgi:hypothetical protein